MSGGYGHVEKVFKSDQPEYLNTFTTVTFSQATPTKENHPPSHNQKKDGNKRAHHNLLERQRRDEINASYTALQNSVSELNGHPKASRQDVLNCAVKHIYTMKSTNGRKAKELVQKRKDNDKLLAQIRLLEEAKGFPPHSFNCEDDDSSDGEDTLDTLRELSEQQSAFMWNP